MKYVDFEIKTGTENMQIDEDLLNKAIETKSKEPIFRLYGWSPACISLGRNQSDDFLDYELLKSLKIDVVRRLTGGRALLHGKELTYSFICPVEHLEHGENVITSYKEICQILIDKFKLLGIELTLGGEKAVRTKFDYCMMVSTGADLCYQGKKLIGSAQLRKNGYILQHGSILLDYDKELLTKIFGSEPLGITSLKEINPNLTCEDLISHLSNK